MKSMGCLCIQFTHENTSERTILHLVKKKKLWVWLLALQERLATPLKQMKNTLPVQPSKLLKLYTQRKKLSTPMFFLK